MRLSNKGRYGVRALFDIAFHNNERPTQVKDIAERQSIPARFLEQIFQDLKRAGLVASRRGPHGGYHLARPAAEIRLGDIVRALEGPISICGPDEDGPERPKGAVAVDATDTVFQELSKEIEQCFDCVTVADICARGEALGLRRGTAHPYTYDI